MSLCCTPISLHHRQQWQNKDDDKYYMSSIERQGLLFLTWSMTSYTSVSQSVQSLSGVQLFVTPWTAAHQPSLSITNSWSLLKFMFTESVMPSNHLILYSPLLLPPSIFPSIRVFSNVSVLHIRWPEYWSFSFSISPSGNIQDWFPLGWTGWISLQFKSISSSRFYLYLLFQRTSLMVWWLRLRAPSTGGPDFNPWSGN